MEHRSSSSGSSSCSMSSEGLIRNRTNEYSSSSSLSCNTFSGGLNRSHVYASSGNSSCSTSKRVSIRHRSNERLYSSSSSCSTPSGGLIRNRNNMYSSSGGLNRTEYSSSVSLGYCTSSRTSIRNRDNDYSSPKIRWRSRSPSNRTKYSLPAAPIVQQNRNRQKMNRFRNESSPMSMTYQDMTRMKKEGSGFNNTEKTHHAISGSIHQTKSTISSKSMTYQPLAMMKNKRRGFNGTENSQTISDSSYQQSKSSLCKKHVRSRSANSKTDQRKSGTQIYVQENKLVSTYNQYSAAKKCVPGKELPDFVVKRYPTPSRVNVRRYPTPSWANVTRYPTPSRANVRRYPTPSRANVRRYPTPSRANDGHTDSSANDVAMYHLDNTDSMSEVYFSDNYMHKLYEEAHLSMCHDDKTTKTSDRSLDFTAKSQEKPADALLKLSCEEFRQNEGFCQKSNEPSNVDEGKNIAPVERSTEVAVTTTSVHVEDQLSCRDSAEIEFSDTINVSNHGHDSKVAAFRQNSSESGTNARLLDNMSKRSHTTSTPKDCTRKRSRFIADHEDSTCSGGSPKRSRYETTMMPNGSLMYSQLQRLRDRRAEMEETFSGDCNDVCEVVKMLVRRNPCQESRLLDSLEANLDNKQIQFFSKFEDIVREIVGDDMRL